MEPSHYVQHWNEWPFPVIPVSQSLNPFADDGVELFAAVAYHLPYENIKFLTVGGLLRGAQKSGALNGVHTLVENTSGSTGVTLPNMARSYGNFRIKLIVPPDIPDGKRYPLLLAGAELISPEDGLSGIATARKMGTLPGHHNLDQYANLDGTTLHETVAAQTIIDRFGGAPEVLVSGIGTGGTIVGISRGLRKHSENVTIVGVLLAPKQEIPGVRDRDRMKEITLPWEEATDEIVEISTRPSYLASLWFSWAMGLTPGPSSGFAYLGGLQFLKQRKAAGTLDALRNPEGKIRVVIVFPDSNRPYGDRFMANLPYEYQKPKTAPLPWQFPGYEI